MSAEESLRGGRVDEALAKLEDQVRREPQAAKHRVFLFQLLAVMGRWERAFNQLRVAHELDPSSEPMVRTYREALRAEMVRADVFAGKVTPIVMGEPSGWVAQLVEALRLDGQGHHAEANALRIAGLEAAPARAGRIDDRPFAWLGDADPRLGPVFELVLNGRYLWLPAERVVDLKLDPPADLRDLVWAPGWVTLETEGTVPVLVPTRYPGSEADPNSAIRLARHTTWSEGEPGASRGLGQRMFATDAGEFPLLEVRAIVFDRGEVAPGG